MVKKMISVATAFLLLCCMIPFAAFADDVLEDCPKCGERTYETWTDCSTEVPDIGFPISIKRRHCTSCDYTYYDWNCLGFTGYKEFDSGSGVLLADYLKEWKNKTFGSGASSTKIDATNGGANIPAAGGRNPKGYGDEGKADVTSSGAEVLWAEPFGISRTGSRFDKDAPYSLISGRSGSGTSYFDDSYCTATYYFTAPVTGLYYVGKSGSPYDLGTFNYLNGDTWKCVDLIFKFTQAYQYSISLKQGESCYLYLYKSSSYWKSKPYKYYLNNCPIFVEPLGDSSITTVNNITITNNNYSQTWNGNIYTDNSSNLTYIYPQYTTINESGDTVTNISENPIIYNNETKQYYTYDKITNNYYYITYVEPTPTPSPEPSPSPTPDPGTDPTPTPTPGEDTGDTPTIIQLLESIRLTLVNGFKGITEKLTNIGVGGSTPETAKPGSSGDKGQSWWEKLLGKIGDAIIDGLLGAISAVLKLIFKLFSTILGWIIWLVSQVLTLFPFLPPGLGALLIGGVVVCFVIGIIKFIRG